VTADNIKKYRASILDKMQVQSMAELIVLCREAGIVQSRSHNSHTQGAEGEG